MIENEREKANYIRKTTTRSHSWWQDTVLPLLLCMCFIASSLLFLFHMIVKSQEENIEYLFNAANQKKISIIKQIEGDLQTLEGIAIILGGMDSISQEQLIPMLKAINDDNAFIRMGFAEPDGEAWLVDLEGKIYEQNLWELDFFQEALLGQGNVSDIFPDNLEDNHYVNYYGVGIKNSSGEITGVLCAVHSADVLRKIIDAPVLSGEGFSSIVSGEGKYILRSANAVPSELMERNQLLIREAVESGGTASFTMSYINGKKQIATVIPVLENRWYLLSMVPQEVLRSRYIETAAGIMVIIVLACCLFALFITKQRLTSLRVQKILMEIAYRDSLTGLRNYDGFKLEVAPRLAKGELSSCFLWYGDLNNFKFINDILGYEEGDKILKRISSRLQEMENNDFMACRVSADNFVGIARWETAELLTNRVLELQEYLRNTGMEGRAFIELTVGFYRFNSGDDKVSVDVLVNYANMARKMAKEGNGEGCAFYDEKARRRQIEDSMLEAEAEKAMEEREFKVYMQPKVNIQKNNHLAGAEALVRWINPQKGLIPPDRFIPLFERNGQIVALDRYMFCRTCEWYQGYLRDGGLPLSIAVNVSKVGLLQKDFIEYYSKKKEEYEIPDGYLELEFTEGVLLNDMDMFSDIVRSLQSRGFICSLDDFGSGYSSLNLLKNLPIDVLKLDMMFFHKSKDLGRERIVISNFVHMAKELKIKTIAEGVETVDNVGFLRECGCDVIQGYVFSKPIPLEEFDRLARTEGGKSMTPADAS